MNRNSENHFAQFPTVSIERSTIHMPKNIKTTFNAGDLIPFWVDQNVLPGDTYKVNASFVVRMSTPIVPTMDNLIFDTYFFYVPNRITWQHWKEFMGENTTGAWAQEIQYSVPQVTFQGNPKCSIQKGDIAHYMALPLFTTASTNKISVSRMPFTAYGMIWNEYFRAQNLEAPLGIYTGDTDCTMPADTASNRSDWHDTNIATAKYTGFMPATPAPVNKTADYLTTCNPSPQKGSAVSLSLPAQEFDISIYGNGKAIGLTDGTNNAGLINKGQTYGGLLTATGAYNKNVGTDGSGSVLNTSTNGVTIGLTTDPTKSGIVGLGDLSNLVGATINAQRLSFATQRILERDTFGTRYREVLRNHFHVSGPNVEGRQQVPEYLGGKRQALNIQQTVQSSETANTPLGTTGAFSLTVASDRMFTKSFTEHGMIIGLCCVRILRHSYSQAIERPWSRRERLDFYWPELAHLGEQEVRCKEVFADGSAQDDEIFGYQERWAEYRYNRDVATGAMDPCYAQALSQWSYTDKYTNCPVLSGEWSNEDKTLIDRTLAVTSAVEDQFIMDCWLDLTESKPLPIYSLPGLIDHY